MVLINLFYNNIFQKSAEVGTGGITLPEDLGRECAINLLDEIHRGGAVDSAFQWILALWMALGQKDVSECIVSNLYNNLMYLKKFLFLQLFTYYNTFFFI